MIYEVKVRVVQEGTVFVEAKTQDEAKKAATSDSIALVAQSDFFSIKIVGNKKTSGT